MVRFPPTRRIVGVVLAIASVLLVGGGAASATSEPDRVVDILELSGPIDPPVAAAISDLVQDANRRGSELVILTIDAPSGLAVRADEVVRSLEASRVPVAVWVGPGAARAGGVAAFLVAAAHVRSMSSRASLGPACPPTVASTCDAASERLAARLLGVPSGTSLADAGWPVGEPIDADLARDSGHIDLVVEGLEPLLVELDGRGVTTAAGPRTLALASDEVTVRLHKLGPLRRTLHAALTPSLVYLLLIAVVLLLGFEVFQPGFGVAGVAGVLLLPLAVYGLVVLPVAWWALVLVLLGLLLLAVDLAIAGLGVPTVAGAAALAVGSWWLFGAEGLRLAPWLVVVTVLACVLFFTLVMTVVLRAQAGPDPGAVGPHLLGRVGVVRSAMNPEGHVFVDGALWRARWDGEERGRIRAGARVRVQGLDDRVLLVDDADVPADRSAPDPPTGAA